MAASRDITISGCSADRLGLVIGPVAVLAMLLWMARWTGSEAWLGIDALLILCTSFPLVLLWLGASFGLGWPLRRWLCDESANAWALQGVLGVATMLVLVSTLGRLGLLQTANNIGSWGLIVLGIGLLILSFHSCATAVDQRMTFKAPDWLMWLAAPAIAALLLASTSAPGWLWASEFGGYDAMSYHLQLPKQWLDMGAITPLEHNVYSFLPSYLEGAFYHLMILRGGDVPAISAVYACQLLHAALAIMVGWTISRMFAGSSRSVAFVILLGTPWVIVVGSLAYNEMATLLMLAGGVLVLRDDRIGACSKGMLLGVFAAVACGAKLTAIGFVAAPLGVGLLMTLPARAWMRAIIAGAMVGCLVLLPYLLANAAATGNPVFPFATGMFGTGHWNAQQVAIWTQAHQSDLAWPAKFSEATQQFLRYGIGPNPNPAEPWYAQWSILPWLALLSIVVWLVQRARRTLEDATHRMVLMLVLMMLVQLAFWMTLTHIKSRFMLPLTVPASMMVVMMLCRVNLHRAVLSGALLAWSLVPVYIFTQQADRAPAARIGAAELLTGHGLLPSKIESIAAIHPAIYLNHLLPEDAHVLLLGEAAPLYVLHNSTYQTTWDRGPMSMAMDRAEDDAQQWFVMLWEYGFTHVLVDGPMLERWEQANWHDPRLTSDRIIPAADVYADLVQQWPNGQRLYRLR